MGNKFQGRNVLDTKELTSVSDPVGIEKSVERCELFELLVFLRGLVSGRIMEGVCSVSYENSFLRVQDPSLEKTP